jgi:hypothetical protein
MGVPWTAFLASSGGAAVLFASLKPQWTTALVLSVLAKAYLAHVAGWVLYKVLVVPHYLSPLVGLPEPEGSHWLLGQFARIAKDPTGIPMREWYAIL